MRKKLALLALAALITLVTATPVLAALDGGGQPFSLVGTITAIGADTITVEALNYRFVGQELTVKVTGDTRFFEWTADGPLPIIFDDVDVGDSTNMKGTMPDGVFVASQVTVDVRLYRTQ